MVLECVGGGFSGLKPLGTSGPENTLENIFLHLFQGDEFYVLPGPFFACYYSLKQAEGPQLVFHSDMNLPGGQNLQLI